MTINNRIRNKKLQYNINIEAAKILAWLSAKIDRYEYLTEEEILPSDQTYIIYNFSQKKVDYDKLTYYFNNGN